MTHDDDAKGVSKMELPLKVDLPYGMEEEDFDWSLETVMGYMVPKLSGTVNVFLRNLDDEAALRVTVAARALARRYPEADEDILLYTALVWERG